MTPESSAARRLLDNLHERAVNFDVDRRLEYTSASGWHVDNYCRPLAPEPPGEPVAEGSWAIARDLLRDYEFADPAIVPVVYYHEGPLDDRAMVLAARFCGVTFHLGVRVGGVRDTTAEIDGRRVRVWGWNYRTLQGHLEMGQMDYEVWKWIDTGEVEFRIHVVSRPARIANPIVRFGFGLFGRRMQVRFAKRALERLDRLVDARLTGATDTDTVHTLERIVIQRG